MKKKKTENNPPTDNKNAVLVPIHLYLLNDHTIYLGQELLNENGFLFSENKFCFFKKISFFL